MYIENLFKELDGLFNENRSYNFVADIIEKENGFIIVGELPGVKKENINIECMDQVLSVTAKVEIDDNQKYLLRERRSKTLKRTFSLGDIDEESISARFENGLLFINVNFREVKKEKKTIIVE